MRFGSHKSYMCYPRAIYLRSAMIGAMSRLAVVAFFLITGCTKAPQDTGGAPAPSTGGKLEVPGGDKGIGGPETVKGGATNDTRYRLAPEEGKLAIEVPADAKANAETIAKITVTASSTYKVNTEFPTKLTLETTSGVQLAKVELKAGGHDKAKGDADVFDEHELVFAVKLTPAASGSYTINGSFKFAVCDKAGSTCLAKKEPIAIQVAAK
jgi:hypothetical protein